MSKYNELDEQIKGLPKKLRLLCQDVPVGYFYQCPGGSSHHHNYKGGLYVHTSEVVDFAQQMAHDGDLCDLVTVAAVFHDRNKIFEYHIDDAGKITSLDYRYLVGHVVGSYEFFKERAAWHKIPQDFTDRVAHAILAHHGRLEWRSPIEPQTMEAFILHSADMLSMQKGMRELKLNPAFKHQ